MSVTSRMRNQARKTKTRKPIKGGSISDVKGFEKLLGEFEPALRYKVLVEATKAAGRVVRKAARNNLAGHRSKKTGTRDAWSQKVRQRREAQDMDLFQSISVRTVNIDKGVGKGGAVITMVGPRRPKTGGGGIGHLVEFGGYKKRLWGKQFQMEMEPPRPFLRPASQSTKAAQTQAIFNHIRKKWDKV